MSRMQVMSPARLLGVFALLQIGLGCVTGRTCDWTCSADAYMEAERDGADSADAPERADRVLKARRAAEWTLWSTCVPPIAKVIASVAGGPAPERQRAVTVAEVRGYDTPELLSALLVSYPSEDDALTRIRILRVLRLARQSSLDALPVVEFDVLRGEAKPSVMASAINVFRRLPPDITVPLLAEYMSRGPRWILIAAYGVANELGSADKVRAELTRRGARDVLDVISQWEKTGQTPWDPKGPDATEPAK